MSEVISCRLNQRNPREKRASEILLEWRGKGYSTRYIFTEALLRLEDSAVNRTSVENNDDLPQLIARIDQLLEQEEKRWSKNNHEANQKLPLEELSDSFLASVKEGAKPGLKLR